jgi:hypothetical protein
LSSIGLFRIGLAEQPVKYRVAFGPQRIEIGVSLKECVNTVEPVVHVIQTIQNDRFKGTWPFG